jgi:hypothetical protein
MKKIIVTPAGRKRYLEILLSYLIKYKDEFDRWDIWLNTENKEDIEYIKFISSQYDFIKIIYPDVKVNGNLSIGSFFKDYKNPNEFYIRLDDDIVYIEKNSLKILFEKRIKDKDSFLLYGNIINNAVITHIHQRTGNLSNHYGFSSYNCMCNIGWSNSIFAESLHRDFLSNKDKISFVLPDWYLFNNERVSINVISWRGDEFLKFNGNVGLDEEQWLSVDKPKSIGKYNKIIGNTLFVHYSFYTQREHLDKTDILEKYKELCNTIT